MVTQFSDYICLCTPTFIYLIFDQQIQDTNKDKKVIGSLNVPLKTLMQAPDMTMYRPFQLKNAATNSTITLRICMRVCGIGALYVNFIVNI